MHWLPSEIEEINERLDDFNQVVENAANMHADRVAFVDVNQSLANLYIARAANIDNVGLTYSMPPPTGIFSEEGIHPNSRGYAYLARIFIEAINEKFGASVPLPDLGNYQGTALPINP